MVYPPSINLSDLSLVRSMVGFLVAYPGYPDSSLDDLEGPPFQQSSISTQSTLEITKLIIWVYVMIYIYVYIHNLRYRMLYLHQTNSGWWFGTWILWLSQWISSSQLTKSIFQRARAKNHQPVKVFTKLQTNLQLSYATRVTASSEHRQVLGAMLSSTVVGFVTNVVI